CIGDADEDGNWNGDEARTRLAWRAESLSPRPKGIRLLPFSVQLRPIRLFRSSKLLGPAGRDGLSRRRRPNGLRRFRSWRTRKLAGMPPRPRGFLLTWLVELLSSQGANSRLVRWFPPDSRPQLNPTPFGATVSPRAPTTDHGPTNSLEPPSPTCP